MVDPQQVFHGYVHEAIAGVVLSGGGYIILFPIRTLVGTVKTEWKSATNKLDAVHMQDNRQTELLGEAVKLLGSINVSQAEVKKALELKNAVEIEKIAEVKTELKAETEVIKSALEVQHDKQQMIWQGVLNTLTVLEDRTRNLK